MYRSGAKTPLLRVSRPVSACSRCRTAKIKCDGKLPACTACEKSGRSEECSSANDQFAKGKERSYVSALESRIEKLERRLSYAQARKASVAMHDADAAPAVVPDRRDSLAKIRAAIHGKAARRREFADVSELVSDFGFLSVDATTRDFETSTTNMTFARLVLAAAMNEPIQVYASADLPSRQVALCLVQFYLDKKYPLYPIFAETALYNALDAIYQTNGRPITDFEHWLLYMVFAIASIAQSQTHLDQSYAQGVAWVGCALHYADGVLTPGYVSQIQALVLLVQYAMLDPMHFDSWHLIGFASRAVIDLGFHQDPPKQQQIDRKLLELRRRIFYCVYSMDRSVSLVHARAFSFTDDSINVEFPAPALVSPREAEPPHTPISGPHSTAPAMALLQLRQMQSAWYQHVFHCFQVPLPEATEYLYAKCNEMTQWAASIPGHVAPIFKDYCTLELYYSFVFCLAPSSRAEGVATFAKAIIFEYCIAYLAKVYESSRDASSMPLYTYHDSLKTFFIGTQFVEVLSKNMNYLLHGIPPHTPMHGASTSPILPPGAGQHNHQRSIECINLAREALRLFGQRWENARALYATFSMHSEPVLRSLQATTASPTFPIMNYQASPTVANWSPINQNLGHANGTSLNTLSE